MRAIRFIPLLACGVVSVLPAQSPATDAPTPAAVSRKQFAQFHWIVGRWRGVGVGRLAAVGTFYEEYRSTNDSTIQMRTAADSTFVRFIDSTSFEWRGGTLRAVGARGNPRMVSRFSEDSIQFGSARGTLYVRLSDDTWRAVFPARTAGEPRPYYELRRIAADQ